MSRLICPVSDGILCEREPSSHKRQNLTVGHAQIPATRVSLTAVQIFKKGLDWIEHLSTGKLMHKDDSKIIHFFILTLYNYTRKWGTTPPYSVAIDAGQV